jgi:hypothetical protein
MNVLPRIYYTNYHKSNDILPGPITTLECVDGDHREKGTLWASWKPAWNGAMVDRWDVLINNDGKVYGTTSNATSISIPGYTPGTEIVFFVRPVVSDQVGDWGEFGKCTV